MAPARIFQPVRGRAVRKLLWKRLGVPRRIVHPILSGAKTAANPTQVRVRRALAGACEADLAVPREAGFRLVSPGELPGAEEATARCAEIYSRLRAEARVEDRLFNPRKRYLLSLLSGNDFCAHPDLLRFMVSRPILDTATAYLGSVPVLAGAVLWWTPENDTAERSQLYHFDAEDDRQLKLLLNVFETREEHGPFTLVPADASAGLRRPRAMRGRLPDAAVAAACGSRAVAVVGGPGSGAFVDTSRCLHFGSRRSRADRVVLMLQFTRFACPTESTFELRVPGDLPGLDLDPIQKLCLGVA